MKINLDFELIHQLFDVRLPPLCTSVLEPRFDLSVGHLQRLGERRSLGRRQVLLFVKAFLQFGDLQSGERRPRFLSLRRRTVLVGVTDAPRHRERR